MRRFKIKTQDFRFLFILTVSEPEHSKIHTLTAIRDAAEKFESYSM